MGKYILKRLGLMVVTAFIIMTILFMMIRLMPVDTPVPPDMPVDYIPNLRKAYGYDEFLRDRLARFIFNDPFLFRFLYLLGLGFFLFLYLLLSHFFH